MHHISVSRVSHNNNFSVLGAECPQLWGLRHLQTLNITKTMATPIQQNLIEKNKAYAASFTQGDLALPPAKKYAVGT